MGNKVTTEESDPIIEIVTDQHGANIDVLLVVDGKRYRIPGVRGYSLDHTVGELRELVIRVLALDKNIIIKETNENEN